MDNQTSYESKLLRVIIGFLHVSLSEQLSVAYFGKPHRNLTQTERDAVQSQVIHSVMTIARQVDEENVDAFLKPPPPPPPDPSGPVN